MTGAAADRWGERLPRRIGLLNAIAVVIGITIGSGIFRVPATVAAQLHDTSPVILCWILGGVVALCGALTIAELAGALPRSGGIFAYLLEGFGPLPAFMFGWTELVVIRAAALGATSTIFAEYLGYFVKLEAAQVRLTAAAAILVIGMLNYIGVQRAAALMSIATALKYVAVMALGLFAFSAAPAMDAHPGSGAGLHLSLLATALIPVMWTYDGWADLSFMGGEVSNPQRTLPLALIFGTLGVTLVYLVVNVGYMHLLSLNEMAHSQLIAAAAADRIPALGGRGAALISAVVVIATFSGLNGSMMTGPRVFFAMADRGLFFSAIARVSPRFRTPSAAIWLATLLGIIYVLQNDFAQLADKFILGIWPFYALAVAAVFVLRRKRPELERPYRVWGYPLLPALFLLASLAMVINAAATDPLNTGVTFAIIGSGVPVFFLWSLWKRRRSGV